MTGFAPRVGILLSTFNGARFLTAQLESFRAQTEPNWILYWRDDGSTDDTVAIMDLFAAQLGPERCRRIEGAHLDATHLGATKSFFALVAATADLGIPMAFADQDDVWLPDKLAWAIAALASISGPALYCSRQLLVDHALHQIGESLPLKRPPGFAAALTQNIATGCTTVLDPAAIHLLAASHPPAATLHDWWSYLVVTGAGGRVIVDERPTVLYRQHGHNLVGAPRTNRERARAALQRGPAVFMGTMRQHVAALLEHREMLTLDAQQILCTIDRALHGNPTTRLRALTLPNFRRQTTAETALFRCWFLLG